MNGREEPAQKPRTALVTIFDYHAMGARSVHATLVHHGFPCDLIMFRGYPQWKGFQLEPRTFEDWPTDHEYELLAGLFREKKYALVGVSFRSFAFPFARRIAETARAAGVKLVIFGGTHPTLRPEDCLEAADLVCVGDGEYPMLDLCRAMAEGRPLSGIENLWVREEGGIVRNPVRRHQPSLDDLPFPALSQEDKFTIEGGKLRTGDPYLTPDRPVSYLIAASRGCPYHCSFCCNRAFRDIYKDRGPWFRFRSPENVIAELEAAKAKFRLAAIGFEDEIFGSSKKWRDEFLPLYGQRVGLPFSCEIHPQVADEDFARSLRAAGGEVIHIGVQSGSERVRNEVFGRPESNEEALAAARALNQAGLATWYDFILNNPFDTPEDMGQTLKLILALPRPFNLKVFTLRWFPGAEITARALREGIITENDLDHANPRGFSQNMALPRHAINRANYFYLTLIWMAALKYVGPRRVLDFFSNEVTGVRQVFSPEFIGRLERSKFLAAHPAVLYRSFTAWLAGAGILLAIARAAATLIRLARGGRFGEIAARLKARFIR